MLIKKSQLDYDINNVTHKVFYSNKTFELLKRDIIKIKNNPKILFIYDKNINNQIIKKFKKTLNSLENKYYAVEVIGGKHNKDTGLLFKIINWSNRALNILPKLIYIGMCVKTQLTTSIAPKTREKYLF